MILLIVGVLLGILLVPVGIVLIFALLLYFDRIDLTGTWTGK